MWLNRWDWAAAGRYQHYKGKRVIERDYSWKMAMKQKGNERLLLHKKKNPNLTSCSNSGRAYGTHEAINNLSRNAVIWDVELLICPVPYIPVQGRYHLAKECSPHSYQTSKWRIYSALC